PGPAPQPARGAGVPLGPARQAGAHRRPRDPGVGRGGRRLLGDPAARQPARGFGIEPERADHQPRAPRRALARAAAALSRSARAPPAPLDRLSRRARHDRVLDPPRASVARPRAVHASRPWLEANAIATLITRPER